MIYITAIGSGKSLNFIHNKGYSGVLGIIERTKRGDLHYVKGSKVLKESQIERFNHSFSHSNYEYINKVIVEANDSLYDIGKIIVTELKNIITKYPKAKLHIETSAGYKRIGHILYLTSYFCKNIDKITFLNNNGDLQLLPKIQIKLTPKEKDILKQFVSGSFVGWDKKISTNKFVKNYNKDRKYIYAIIKNCKTIGLLDENNIITDFGKLYLEFS